MKLKFKIGDLLEVVAVDHTTDDADGWATPDKLIKVEPERLYIAGYYIGETKDTLRLAMCRAGSSYGTQFMVLKAGIETIRRKK